MFWGEKINDLLLCRSQVFPDQMGIAKVSMLDIKEDFKTTKDCHCMNLFLFLWKLSKISEQCNAQNLPFPNAERLTNFKQT